jgi:hypothetical protein
MRSFRAELLLQKDIGTKRSRAIVFDEKNFAILMTLGEKADVIASVIDLSAIA